MKNQREGLESGEVTSYDVLLSLDIVAVSIYYILVTGEA